MDLDRQWRIRDRLAGILAVAYGRYGTSARDQGVIVDTDRAGAVSLRRNTVGHEAARTRQDGGPRVVQAVDHEDEVRLNRVVGDFTDLHMALIARDGCLRALDIGYDTVPAWSVAADALLIHVARRAGWDMAELCRLSMVDGNPVTGDDGFELAAPDQFAVRADGRTYLATMMRGWLSGGVLGHPFKIRCGADGATTYDGKRRPSLTILDQSLPATLMTAVAGRRLDEVVGHPVLDGAEAVIASANGTQGGATSVPKLGVRLRRRRVQLCDPPAGVETSWLDTIIRLSA